nr:uncharacterized protein LOC111988418 isoform X2 [Quercus suber]
MEKIDSAVANARRNIIAAGESVTARKVSQVALLILNLDSWNSLGFPMQEVPSLHRLMLIEGKINAFIHCFVGVQRITSLYDLEVAICKNEGVDSFEELELGPLVRHPLALHYFSLKPVATEVFKITGEEVISFLWKFVYRMKKKNNNVQAEEFLDRKKKNKSYYIDNIQVEEFLDFIAKRRSVASKEELCLRIQNLGMHISAVRKAMNAQTAIIKRPADATSISQRIESISSAQKDFRGKRIRFVSSSSSDDEIDDDPNNANSPSQNVASSDQVTSYPHPAEIEEMTRLGWDDDAWEYPAPASGSPRHNESCYQHPCSTMPGPSGSSENIKKKDKREKKNRKEKKRNFNEADLAIDNQSIKKFIKNWKKACQDHTVPDKVISTKSGMWDSIFDTILAIDQQELTSSHMQNQSEYEIIDVEPSVKDAPEHSVELTHSVSVEDIIRKVAMYFHGIHSYGQSVLEKRINILRKLCDCEFWLAEQFCVNTFKSLGFGEFLMFLEKHASLLPDEIHKFLTGDICEKSPFKVCMLQHQLVVLVSQALNGCIGEKEIETKQMISSLLMRQFPLISFKISEHGCVSDFLDILEKHKNNVSSKGVLFSVTLFEMCYVGDSTAHNGSELLETTKVRIDVSQKAGALGSLTSKDAIEALHRAPLMSDLNTWAHWDLIFAPSLGPLLPWLLNEVNTKELLCLVTKDGKVMRIDHSATVDSFLEAALQGSPFQTAVQLLSLFSLVGGEK